MTPLASIVQLIQLVGVPVVMMLLFWLHIERVEMKEMDIMQGFHAENLKVLNRLVRRLDRIELLIVSPNQTQIHLDEAGEE